MAHRLPFHFRQAMRPAKTPRTGHASNNEAEFEAVIDEIAFVFGKEPADLYAMLTAAYVNVIEQFCVSYDRRVLFIAWKDRAHNDVMCTDVFPLEQGLPFVMVMKSQGMQIGRCTSSGLTKIIVDTPIGPIMRDLLSTFFRQQFFVPSLTQGPLIEDLITLYNDTVFRDKRLVPTKAFYMDNGVLDRGNKGLFVLEFSVLVHQAELFIKQTKLIADIDITNKQELAKYYKMMESITYLDYSNLIDSFTSLKDMKLSKSFFDKLHHFNKLSGIFSYIPIHGFTCSLETLIRLLSENADISDKTLAVRHKGVLENLRTFHKRFSVLDAFYRTMFKLTHLFYCRNEMDPAIFNLLQTISDKLSIPMSANHSILLVNGFTEDIRYWCYDYLSFDSVKEASVNEQNYKILVTFKRNIRRLLTMLNACSDKLDNQKNIVIKTIHAELNNLKRSLEYLLDIIVKFRNIVVTTITCPLVGENISVNMTELTIPNVFLDADNYVYEYDSYKAHVVNNKHIKKFEIELSFINNDACYLYNAYLQDLLKQCEGRATMLNILQDISSTNIIINNDRELFEPIMVKFCEATQNMVISLDTSILEQISYLSKLDIPAIKSLKQMSFYNDISVREYNTIINNFERVIKATEEYIRELEIVHSYFSSVQKFYTKQLFSQFILLVADHKEMSVKFMRTVYSNYLLFVEAGNKHAIRLKYVKVANFQTYLEHCTFIEITRLMTKRMLNSNYLFGRITPESYPDIKLHPSVSKFDKQSVYLFKKICVMVSSNPFLLYFLLETSIGTDFEEDVEPEELKFNVVGISDTISEIFLKLYNETTDLYKQFECYNSLIFQVENNNWFQQFMKQSDICLDWENILTKRMYGGVQMSESLFSSSKSLLELDDIYGSDSKLLTIERSHSDIIMDIYESVVVSPKFRTAKKLFHFNKRSHKIKGPLARFNNTEIIINKACSFNQYIQATYGMLRYLFKLYGLKIRSIMNGIHRLMLEVVKVKQSLTKSDSEKSLEEILAVHNEIINFIGLDNLKAFYDKPIKQPSDLDIIAMEIFTMDFKEKLIESMKMLTLLMYLCIMVPLVNQNSVVSINLSYYTMVDIENDICTTPPYDNMNDLTFDIIQLHELEQKRERVMKVKEKAKRIKEAYKYRNNVKADYKSKYVESIQTLYDYILDYILYKTERFLTKHTLHFQSSNMQGQDFSFSSDDKTTINAEIKPFLEYYDTMSYNINLYTQDIDKTLWQLLDLIKAFDINETFYKNKYGEGNYVAVQSQSKYNGEYIISLIKYLNDYLILRKNMDNSGTTNAFRGTMAKSPKSAKLVNYTNVINIVVVTITYEPISRNRKAEIVNITGAINLFTVLFDYYNTNDIMGPQQANFELMASNNIIGDEEMNKRTIFLKKDIFNLSPNDFEDTNYYCVKSEFDRATNTLRIYKDVDGNITEIKTRSLEFNFPKVTKQNYTIPKAVNIVINLIILTQSASNLLNRVTERFSVETDSKTSGWEFDDTSILMIKCNTIKNDIKTSSFIIDKYVDVLLDYLVYIADGLQAYISQIVEDIQGVYAKTYDGTFESLSELQVIYSNYSEISNDIDKDVALFGSILNSVENNCQFKGRFLNMEFHCNVLKTILSQIWSCLEFARKTEDRKNLIMSEYVEHQLNDESLREECEQEIRMFNSGFYKIYDVENKAEQYVLFRYNTRKHIKYILSEFKSLLEIHRVDLVDESLKPEWNDDSVNPKPLKIKRINPVKEYYDLNQLTFELIRLKHRPLYSSFCVDANIETLNYAFNMFFNSPLLYSLIYNINILLNKLIIVSNSNYRTMKLCLINCKKEDAMNDAQYILGCDYYAFYESTHKALSISSYCNEVTFSVIFYNNVIVRDKTVLKRMNKPLYSMFQSILRILEFVEPNRSTDFEHKNNMAPLIKFTYILEILGYIKDFIHVFYKCQKPAHLISEKNKEAICDICKELESSPSINDYFEQETTLPNERGMNFYKNARSLEDTIFKLKAKYIDMEPGVLPDDNECYIVVLTKILETLETEPRKSEDPFDYLSHVIEIDKIICSENCINRILLLFKKYTTTLRAHVNHNMDIPDSLFSICKDYQMGVEKTLVYSNSNSSSSEFSDDAISALNKKLNNSVKAFEIDYNDMDKQEKINIFDDKDFCLLLLISIPLFFSKLLVDERLMFQKSVKLIQGIILSNFHYVNKNESNNWFLEKLYNLLVAVNMMQSVGITLAKIPYVTRLMSLKEYVSPIGTLVVQKYDRQIQLEQYKYILSDVLTHLYDVVLSKFIPYQHTGGSNLSQNYQYYENTQLGFSQKHVYLYNPIYLPLFAPIDLSNNEMSIYKEDIIIAASKILKTKRELSLYLFNSSLLNIYYDIAEEYLSVLPNEYDILNEFELSSEEYYNSTITHRDAILLSLDRIFECASLGINHPTFNWPSIKAELFESDIFPNKQRPDNFVALLQKELIPIEEETKALISCCLLLHLALQKSRTIRIVCGNYNMSCVIFICQILLKIYKIKFKICSAPIEHNIHYIIVNEFPQEILDPNDNKANPTKIAMEKAYSFSTGEKIRIIVQNVNKNSLIPDEKITNKLYKGNPFIKNIFFQEHEMGELIPTLYIKEKIPVKIHLIAYHNIYNNVNNITASSADYSRVGTKSSLSLNGDTYNSFNYNIIIRSIIEDFESMFSTSEYLKQLINSTKDEIGQNIDNPRVICNQVINMFSMECSNFLSLFVVRFRGMLTSEFVSTICIWLLYWIFISIFFSTSETDMVQDQIHESPISVDNLVVNPFFNQSTAGDILDGDDKGKDTILQIIFSKLLIKYNSKYTSVNDMKLSIPSFKMTSRENEKKVYEVITIPFSNVAKILFASDGKNEASGIHCTLVPTVLMFLICSKNRTNSIYLSNDYKIYRNSLILHYLLEILKTYPRDLLIKILFGTKSENNDADAISNYFKYNTAYTPTVIMFKGAGNKELIKYSKKTSGILCNELRKCCYRQEICNNKPFPKTYLPSISPASLFSYMRNIFCHDSKATETSIKIDALANQQTLLYSLYQIAPSAILLPLLFTYYKSGGEYLNVVQSLFLNVDVYFNIYAKFRAKLDANNSYLSNNQKINEYEPKCYIPLWEDHFAHYHAKDDEDSVYLSRMLEYIDHNLYREILPHIKRYKIMEINEYLSKYDELRASSQFVFHSLPYSLGIFRLMAPHLDCDYFISLCLLRVLCGRFGLLLSTTRQNIVYIIKYILSINLMNGYMNIPQDWDNVSDINMQFEANINSLIHIYTNVHSCDIMCKILSKYKTYYGRRGIPNNKADYPVIVFEVCGKSSFRYYDMLTSLLKKGYCVILNKKKKYELVPVDPIIKMNVLILVETNSEFEICWKQYEYDSLTTNTFSPKYEFNDLMSMNFMYQNDGTDQTLIDNVYYTVFNPNTYVLLYSFKMYNQDILALLKRSLNETILLARPNDASASYETYISMEKLERTAKIIYDIFSSERIENVELNILRSLTTLSGNVEQKLAEDVTYSGFFRSYNIIYMFSKILINKQDDYRSIIDMTKNIVNILNLLTRCCTNDTETLIKRERKLMELRDTELESIANNEILNKKLEQNTIALKNLYCKYENYMICQSDIEQLYSLLVCESRTLEAFVQYFGSNFKNINVRTLLNRDTMLEGLGYLNMKIIDTILSALNGFVSKTDIRLMIKPPDRIARRVTMMKMDEIVFTKLFNTEINFEQQFLDQKLDYSRYVPMKMVRALFLNIINKYELEITHEEVDKALNLDIFSEKDTIFPAYFKVIRRLKRARLIGLNPDPSLVTYDMSAVNYRGSRIAGRLTKRLYVNPVTKQILERVDKADKDLFYITILTLSLVDLCSLRLFTAYLALIHNFNKEITFSIFGNMNAIRKDTNKVEQRISDNNRNICGYQLQLSQATKLRLQYMQMSDSLMAFRERAHALIIENLGIPVDFSAGKHRKRSQQTTTQPDDLQIIYSLSLGNSLLAALILGAEMKEKSINRYMKQIIAGKIEMEIEPTNKNSVITQFSSQNNIIMRNFNGDYLMRVASYAMGTQLTSSLERELEDLPGRPFEKILPVSVICIARCLRTEIIPLVVLNDLMTADKLIILVHIILRIQNSGSERSKIVELLSEELLSPSARHAILADTSIGCIILNIDELSSPPTLLTVWLELKERGILLLCVRNDLNIYGSKQVVPSYSMLDIFCVSEFFECYSSEQTPIDAIPRVLLGMNEALSIYKDNGAAEYEKVGSICELVNRLLNE